MVPRDPPPAPQHSSPFMGVHEKGPQLPVSADGQAGPFPQAPFLGSSTDPKLG